MSNNVGVTFRVSPELTNLADNVQRKLVQKLLPRALGKAVPIVREAIRAEVPDGNKPTPGSPRGSRAKQSAKSKARFPYHLKDRVRVKSVSDQAGLLKIVGVDRKGSHVNFDHGKKAKTSGRVHKLWWVKGSHEVYATPKLRKQTQDVPRIVAEKVGGQVQSVIEAELRSGIASGGLAK